MECHYPNLTRQLFNKIDNHWLSFLLKESHQPYFQTLLELLDHYQERISPKLDSIFQAYRVCDLNQVKVVILGQDPYPGANVADGLAFSTQQSKTPSSLRNIFQELKANTQICRKNNNLLDWAQQGVLLLNTSLTIIDNEINSCRQWPWKDLIIQTILMLNQTLNHYVVVLWGKHAQSYASYFDQNKVTILSSSHPSPLSAHQSFFGSNVFNKINQDLKQHHLPEIKWG